MAAFDTVDLDILIKKLQYYGLDNKTLRLMTSFLTDRRQFVNIDSFDSTIQKCPPCSVIQGSKISSMLYTVYTNEIPQLYKLITNDDYYNITKTILLYDYDKITHETLNYIDDSTIMITTTDTGQLLLLLSVSCNIHSYAM